MKPIYLTVIAALLLFSCKKNEVSLPGETIIPAPEPEYIKTSVQGIVTDETGSPAEGTTITYGTRTTNTNAKGIFRFDSVLADLHASVVKVQRAGYFDGFRTFIPNKDILNYVHLKLIPKQVAGKFAAANGGTITVPDGGTISFTSGSVVNAASKTSYTGEVTVYARYIDPTLTELAEMIAGNSSGVLKNGKGTGVRSFGVMAVELMGGGEKLQLAMGKPATLTVPIPSGIAGSAPATITLGSFDETRGVWKEEGSARKEGSVYTGQVTHFSIWDYYVPYPASTFEVNLKTSNGIALFDARTEIKEVNGMSYFSGYSDSAGKVSGFLPAGKQLQINVRDICNNVIYTQNIGPFTENKNIKLDTIIAIVSPADLVTLTGKVISCAGNVVKNGYVNMLLDNYNYTSKITNGNFSFKIYRCSSSTSTASFYALDVDSSRSVRFTSAVSKTSSDLGTYAPCELSATEFFNMTIDGTSYNITQGNSGIFSCYEAPEMPGTYFIFANNATDKFGGVITVNGLGAGYTFDFAFTTSLYFHQVTYFNLNITEFGGLGNYMSGTFSGIYAQSPKGSVPEYKEGTLPMSGSFRFKVKAGE